MSAAFITEKVNTPKTKPDQNALGFGVHFTDHMFVMDYTEGQGWHDPRIIPYGPLLMDPSTMVLHYGQATFEGLKAYRAEDGRVLLFRPEANMNRLNLSNDRLCIPAIDPQIGIKAMCELIKVEEAWIPTEEGTSLYIRPFVIATDPYLGVRPSNTYKFMVILSPVGAYYPEGMNPIKIHVEELYVRAVRGGLGHTKTPSNYAASLKAQEEAKKKGYTQVLWLDGTEKEYVEEVGTMNVFFKVNGEVITPDLTGSILPGITRDSAIQLLQSWGIKVTERPISIFEIYDAQRNGTLDEVFGTGTAAVISPVGELNFKDDIIQINNGEIGELSNRLYDALTGIQMGKLEDPFGWVYEVK